ncbi:hypothetical protein K9M79_00600 [Candidatus Woesearchaeota archaeon]|nr:hypothetical protein [Candidatus Woesearchaeota archaeon]
MKPVFFPKRINTTIHQLISNDTIYEWFDKMKVPLISDIYEFIMRPVSSVLDPKNDKAKCNDVLLGAREPAECPLFKRECTPNNPLHKSMAHEEGNCAISFKFSKK